MALGADHSGVAAEFVAAMRPIAGDNVDLAPVQANLGALGLAVYRTLTVDAEARSDATADEDFWRWATAMADWIAAVSAAFAGWVPTTPAEQALRLVLTAVPSPPPVPESLRARLQ